MKEKNAVIENLRAHSGELQTKIEQLMRDRQAVERVIQSLRTIVEGQGAEDHKPSGYESMTPQQGVERFLREHPRRKFRAGQIGKKLIALGLPKRSRSFTSQIISALNRACAKGVGVRERGENGRSVYYLKEDSPA